MDKIMVGMFDTRQAAEAAQRQLQAAGFESSDISLHSDDGSRSMSGSSAEYGKDSSAQEGGSISRFFRSLFGNEDSDVQQQPYAQTYGEAFRRGAFALTVRPDTDDQADRAEEVLNEAGAVDIDERSEAWRKDGWTLPAASTAAAATTGASGTLNEIDEELKVGKREVARGGVRVFTRMTSTPVEETIHLREERAKVERRPVDRAATTADLDAFQEGSLEVRESSEEAVVSKTARVVGEVAVGKTVTERDETIRDTVRKSRVEVEQLGTNASGTETTTKQTTSRNPGNGRS